MLLRKKIPEDFNNFNFKGSNTDNPYSGSNLTKNLNVYCCT